MDTSELMNLIAGGETSKVQFKERLPHHDSLAQEMVAFANAKGGLIIIGVNDKTGNVNGLSFEEKRYINQQVATVATQHVFPQVYVNSETVTVNGNDLIVVEIPEGISKPYKDKNGTIFKKSGSDKRKVTSNDEILRLLHSSKIVYADEMPVQDTTIDDIDIEKFKQFIKIKYNKSIEELKLDITTALHNLNLMKGGTLTLAGLLLFGNNRQKFRPQFTIQCIAVNDVKITGDEYMDMEYPIDGAIPEVFERALAFIKRNIRNVQDGPTFNSPSKPEIPYQVFEELLVNAIVHRDYFVNTTIKIFVFADRIEIISPGSLPNSLTIENILNGITNHRNPLLLSLALYLLPYRGLGTGVQRAIDLYPDITFTNGEDEQRFIVSIRRLKK